MLILLACLGKVLTKYVQSYMLSLFLRVTEVGTRKSRTDRLAPEQTEADWDYKMASLHKLEGKGRALEASCRVCRERLVSSRRRSRGAFMPLPVCAAVLAGLFLTLTLALAI